MEKNFNKNKFKKVAAIHDISGLGRCSLNVIMPVLSTMQAIICAVPTAVFSAHTGFSANVIKSDLSEHIIPLLKNYKSLNAQFDCVYSGFIGNINQIDSIEAFFNEYSNAFKVVDPVMGNNGKFYSGFDKDFREKIKSLIKKADLITPNLTECCDILNIPYTSAPISREELKSYLSKLSFLGPNYVVITGVTLSSGKICNVGFDKSSSDYWCSYYKPLPEVYPGMGDVFTAVLVGSILQGNSFALSIETATRYIETTALTTFSYKTPVRDGLLLEATLGWLGKEHFFNEYEKI